MVNRFSYGGQATSPKKREEGVENGGTYEDVALSDRILSLENTVEALKHCLVMVDSKMEALKEYVFKMERGEL